jgi:O-antigen/teichoic acid export membrane protein
MASMIGEQIILMRDQEKWLIVAVGSAIFASAINFPLLGVFLLLGIYWLSLGLMTTWFWEKRSILLKPKKNKIPTE